MTRLATCSRCSCSPRCRVSSGHDLHFDQQPLIHLRKRKLKPGIYQIQNLYNDAYLDIHEHSAREMHLRPAQDLREEMGLVRQYHSPVAWNMCLTV